MARRSKQLQGTWFEVYRRYNRQVEYEPAHTAAKKIFICHAPGMGTPGGGPSIYAPRVRSPEAMAYSAGCRMFLGSWQLPDRSLINIDMRQLSHAHGARLPSAGPQLQLCKLSAEFGRLKYKLVDRASRQTCLRSMRPSAAISLNRCLIVAKDHIPNCCQSRRDETAFSSPSGTSLRR